MRGILLSKLFKANVDYNKYVSSLKRGRHAIRKDYFSKYPKELLEKFKFLTETDYYTLVRSDYRKGAVFDSTPPSHNPHIEYKSKGMWSGQLELHKMVTNFLNAFLDESEDATDVILDLSTCKVNSAGTGIIDMYDRIHAFDSREFRLGLILNYLNLEYADSIKEDIILAYNNYNQRVSDDKFSENLQAIKKLLDKRDFQLLRFEGKDGIVDCTNTERDKHLTIFDDSFTIIYVTRWLVVVQDNKDKDLYGIQIRGQDSTLRGNYLYLQRLHGYMSDAVFEDFKEGVIKRNYLFSYFFVFFCYTYIEKEGSDELLRKKCNFEDMENLKYE